MPELPEVETIRRALEPVLAGASVVAASIVDPRLTRPFDPDVVARSLAGERVEAVDRRGKYLLFRFASRRTLVVHLRMTGSFRSARAGELGVDTHRRAVVELDNDHEIGYRDVRRFGTWELLEPGELDAYLDARLGLEPFDTRLDGARLAALLAGRRAPVKAFLLDQRHIAGVGNIYADEALWYAHIHPRRRAGSLTRRESTAVLRGMRRALRIGIAGAGASLRDYAAPDGSTGSMQDEFHVYGRAGEPCDRCGHHLERIVVAGRGTTLCPRCQVEHDRL